MYNFLSIKILNQSNGVFYQARLNSKLGRKTIGLGSDEFLAMVIAKRLDENISECVNNFKPVNIDELKSLAKKLISDEKSKKSPSLEISTNNELSNLYKQYVDFNLSTGSWKEGYYITDIRGIESLLRKSPYKKLNQKNEFIKWLFSDKNRTKKTSKKYLMFLVAAIDWCSKQGIINRNVGIEWRDALNSILIKKQKSATTDDDKSIDIFTVEEVYKIINAFKNETFSRYKGKHFQYYPYVYFCWLSGCRPSEAIALKWDNVDLVKFLIKFCEVERDANGTICKQVGTKTVDYRYFPINTELLNLLLSISKKSNYVFTDSKGKPIRQRSFINVWRRVLLGLGIRYRIPYQLRHTMISYHANNNYPLHKLSSIVGNSEAIIKKHYLKLDFDKIKLPDISSD